MRQVGGGFYRNPNVQCCMSLGGGSREGNIEKERSWGEWREIHEFRGMHVAMDSLGGYERPGRLPPEACLPCW